MKKSLKLLSIGAAAAVWMGLAGTMFVYVVSDQGLFSAHKPGTGEAILLTDEDLQDRINELISGGLYDPEGDIIGDYSFDRPLAVGDVLQFGDMAIYSMVKNNTFNGMPLPAIARRAADGTVSVVRSFGYEDFKSRL